MMNAPRTAAVALGLALACWSCTSEVDPPAPQPAPEPAQAPNAATEPAPAASPAPASDAVPVPQDRPAVAAFEQVVHDFGTIDDTRTVHCEFRFTNDGDTTLNVTKVKSSCGCTTAELERTVFEPGEGDVIVVDWKPKGTGQQQQTVDVLTDSPARRATRLTVRAKVEPKVVPEPRSAEFGKIPMGSTHVKTITLTSSTPGVEVLGVQPGVDALRASWIPNEGGPDELLGVLELRLTPSRRGGFASYVVATIRAPADEQAPERVYELKLPMRASIYGAVQSEPDGFYVGVVKPAGDVRYSLRLRRPDGAAFGMASAEIESCTVEGLSVDAVEGDDEQGHYVDLVLTGPVGDYLGALRGQVRLLTDIADDTPWDLPIMGMVRD